MLAGLLYLTRTAQVLYISLLPMLVIIYGRTLSKWEEKTLSKYLRPVAVLSVSALITVSPWLYRNSHLNDSESLISALPNSLTSVSANFVELIYYGQSVSNWRTVHKPRLEETTRLIVEELKSYGSDAVDCISHIPSDIHSHPLTVGFLSKENPQCVKWVERAILESGLSQDITVIARAGLRSILATTFLGGGSTIRAYLSAHEGTADLSLSDRLIYPAYTFALLFSLIFHGLALFGLLVFTLKNWANRTHWFFVLTLVIFFRVVRLCWKCTVQNPVGAYFCNLCDPCRSTGCEEIDAASPKKVTAHPSPCLSNLPATY